MLPRIALVSLLVFAVSAAAAPTQPPLLKPTPAEAKAAYLSAQALTRFHYAPQPLDDAMSQKIFKAYFDALDGEKLFFTQADIDRFGAARTQLDDAIWNGDLAVPFAIFNLYEQRVVERLGYARGLLAKGFDFGVDESYDYDRKNAAWPKDDAEVNDLWRRRVKNDWLRLKLAGKNDADIRKTLDKRYANYLDRVQQLDAEDVFQTFMNAYATSTDPHTNYFGPRASQNFDIAMKLSLEGIGAVLERRDEYTQIREIVPGGPAAKSGKLHVGDRIVGVGQGTSGPITDVVGWRVDDVVELIRGPKDTTVRLEILPADAGVDGKHVNVALVRKKVSIEEQAAKKSIIEVKDGGAVRRIGVIDLPTFYQDFDARRRGDPEFKSATRDVARLLDELKQAKVDGVIVDLRNNGGGSLDEATRLTGLFIDKGPVVQRRAANGRIVEDDDTDPGMAWSGPLAVLVNRGSASASEIFAAAIQDYGRGLVIGEPTFGKGTVQNLANLDEMMGNEKPEYGELKMTTEEFFRIDGGSTQLRGVTPDIVFPKTVDAGDFGESSYDNALPWTQIAPAQYRKVADLSPLVPLLKQRHDARVARDPEWKLYLDELAAAQRAHDQTRVSLVYDVRERERKQTEAEQAAFKAREKALQQASAGAAGKSAAPAGVATAAKPASGSSDALVRIDDGLQPGERSLKTELAEEKAAEDARDVLLQEAAHILADEVDLVHADTRLAARVLPAQKSPID
ncbi:C-terminal processing peptidase [Mizugakiibacter sediminis]|uniref:C-terminal processing peptidase n=2 Tax=Mizugakiibacter sediminis TaxID=1475481 RepID=A0A0K8QMR5_9GAMM|nr:carboxy terminal-processing peptidase [Mizugakiibacter sediminis]GAP66190.1 C-terminal processing peptidase [Mizugakiibacter sediminis]